MIQKHLSSLHPGTCLRRNWTSARYRSYGAQLLPQSRSFAYLKACFSPPQIKDASISDGCLLRECSIEHSVIGVCSRVSYGCELKVHLCQCVCWCFIHSLASNLIRVTTISATAIYSLVYHFNTRVHKITQKWFHIRFWTPDRFIKILFVFFLKLKIPPASSIDIIFNLFSTWTPQFLLLLYIPPNPRGPDYHDMNTTRILNPDLEFILFVGTVANRWWFILLLHFLITTGLRDDGSGHLWNWRRSFKATVSWEGPSWNRREHKDKVSIGCGATLNMYNHR